MRKVPALNSQLEDDWRFVLAKTGRAKPGAGTTSSLSGGGGASSPTPAAMRASLMRAVQPKPQVMLKITRFSKTAAGVRAHLSYISRTGEYAKKADAPVPVYDQNGAELNDPDDIQRAGELLAAGIPGLAAEGAKPKHGRKRERVAMHMMLSMPPGTDESRFEEGVRDFLQERFGQHEYLFAFHDDTNHYHAHVVIGMQGLDGRWLRPGPADLTDWRQDFADALERHGIEAQASRAYSRGQAPKNIPSPTWQMDKHNRRTRRKPSTHDQGIEDRAIEARASAWRRLGDHYADQRDAEAAAAIRSHLAEQFSDHAPAPAPAPAAGEGAASAKPDARIDPAGSRLEEKPLPTDPAPAAEPATVPQKGSRRRKGEDRER